jgi:hypothetical protein
VDSTVSMIGLLKEKILGEEKKPTRILGGLAKDVWMDLDRSTHVRLICGLYEPSIGSFLKKELRNAQVCYDIGANVGYYSLLFATQPSVREVHAFEPISRLIRDFKYNMELNAGLAPKIQLHEASLGNGMVGVTLDQWMADHRLPQPDIVKIDVDGPEAEILRGSRQLLEKRGTSWVVETHSTPLEEEVERLFRNLGYRTRFPASPWWLSWFPEERLHLPNRHVIAVPE